MASQVNNYAADSIAIYGQTSTTAAGQSVTGAGVAVLSDAISVEAVCWQTGTVDTGHQQNIGLYASGVATALAVFPSSATPVRLKFDRLTGLAGKTLQFKLIATGAAASVWNVAAAINHLA